MPMPWIHGMGMSPVTAFADHMGGRRQADLSEEYGIMDISADCTPRPHSGFGAACSPL